MADIQVFYYCLCSGLEYSTHQIKRHIAKSGAHHVGRVQQTQSLAQKQNNSTVQLGDDPSLTTAQVLDQAAEAVHSGDPLESELGASLLRKGQSFFAKSDYAAASEAYLKSCQLYYHLSRK